VRAVGERLPERGAEIVTASATKSVFDYVVCDDAEGFAASLRSQGATILDVSPMNLSEIFLVLAGKESHVPQEVFA
jgi:hypothetical protein